MSYFVRVETDKGDRDIWGMDLEREFRHSLSNPGIGGEVGIRALGKEAVTVLAAKRDAAGRGHLPAAASFRSQILQGQHRDCGRTRLTVGYCDVLHPG
jgi:hypothetical protein